MSKHTPRPWRFEYGEIRAEDKNGIVRALAKVEKVVGEDEANAHLIAAAPEMLEALEEVARLPIAGPYPDGPCLDQADMDLVKAAIAKATGEEVKP